MITELFTQLQQGDIILTTTDSYSHQFLREIFTFKYDHLSVVLSQEQILHISWPRVRIIHPSQLLTAASQIKVLRPTFSNKQELELFVNVLRSSLDAKYNYTHLIKCMFNKMRAQDIYHQAKFEKNVVCTDLIFYSLHTASERFRQILKEKIQLLDFRIVGTFSADDLDHLSRLTNFFTPVLEREISKITKFDIEQLYDNIQRMMILLNLYRIVRQPLTIPKEMYKLIRKRNQRISPLRAFQLSQHLFQILKLSKRRKSFKNGQKLTYHFLQILNLIKVDNKGQQQDNNNLKYLIYDYAKKNLFGLSAKL